MSAAQIARVLARDIAGVRAELAAYPDDDAPWQAVPGLPNSGGVLARHLAGNLRHFVGAVLGGAGYVRDRDGEFQGPPIPRAALDAALAAAHDDVVAIVTPLPAWRLAEPWPAPLPSGVVLETGQFLQHLASHLAYHLGQLDYHRRTATGDPRGAEVIAIPALATAGPGDGPRHGGVVYEVTGTVAARRRAEYEAWLRDEHVRDVLATGCFRDAWVVRLADGRVRTSYVAASADDLARYVAEHAPRLRALGVERFGDDVRHERAEHARIGAF
jgi:hypothetical protein